MALSGRTLKTDKMERLKIVIPVDFTEQSDYAITYARNFRKNFEIELYLLHVIEVSGFADINTEGHYEDLMGLNAEMLEMQQDKAREQLQALYDREKDAFRELITVLKVGPLTETIVSFAEKMKVDMILMGTKGANRLKAWFSGSETQIVARRSDIPVLTVMSDRRDAAIKDVLLISDFSDPELAPDAIVGKITRAFDARLHMLCIIPEKESDPGPREKAIAKYSRMHHLDAYEVHIHQDNKVLEGINQFDKMEEMDMILIGTHGRKGINHLIRGSIAESLINHLHKPVLVYKI